MINLNANVSSIGNANISKSILDKSGNSNNGFGNTVKSIGNQISKADELQQTADMSIKDLLSGKNEDINTMVSAVAKADMSFKLLVGVRNKLIDAYKQTMNMQI